MQKSRVRKSCLVCAATLVVALTTTTADAALILNQIGTLPSYYNQGRQADVSDFFGPGDVHNAGVVDDFHLNAPTTLTNISTVVLGGSGFSTLSHVTGWEVAIYSSLSAAFSSLTGNVYDRTFPPSSVDLSTPYGGQGNDALVSIATNIPLSSAGTYYVALMGDSTTSNADIFMYDSTGAPGATPGGGNAYFANPGGGFGSHGLGYDAAISISGSAVPEPAALGVLGLAVVNFLSRQRRVLPSGMRELGLESLMHDRSPIEDSRPL